MRVVLIAVVVAVVLGGLAALGLNTRAGQDALLQRGLEANFAAARDAVPIDGLRVVVCGSASPLGNDPERAQACIAVVTAEHFLLFDVGARSPLRMAQANLPMGRLDGVFLTHFHSDHIAALPDVNLQSWVRGRDVPLAVHGPPGVEQVVAGFNMAYGLDRGYRTAHHGEALLPAAVGPMAAGMFDVAAAEVVWRKGDLTVTAFPVAHPPIEPAVGYRVDWKDRAVVISGDTNAADSLFSAAHGADVVFHDALSRDLLDPMIVAAEDAGVPRLPQIMRDVIDYHADVASLEAAAREADIGLLAFYHLVPAPPNAIAEDVFLRSAREGSLLVHDLQKFDLPAGSTAVHITDR